MKKVVSFFAVAAALLIAGSAQAQLGINVGYAPETTTSVVTIGNTSTKSTDVMNGFFAGVNYNINVSGDLNFSVGLQARYNTNSSEDKVGTVTTKINRTKIYASIYAKSKNRWCKVWNITSQCNAKNRFSKIKY